MASEQQMVFLVRKGTGTTPSVDPTPSGEITYTVDEFAAVSYKLFDCSPDAVYAAFKQAGITEATRAVAAQVVANYLGQSY